jgi:hypothetical protein
MTVIQFRVALPVAAVRGIPSNAAYNFGFDNRFRLIALHGQRKDSGLWRGVT